MLTLQDNGPGIAYAKKRRIFEPYFSEKEGGEGLGLSFVAHVVGRHGGIIEEVGTPGKGATFCLYLPVKTLEIERATLSKGETEGASPMTYETFVPDLPRTGPVATAGTTWRTLLVEDDDFVAWKLVERFRDLKVGNRPFEFTAVRSVDDYLAMQKEHLFDVVVLDISLFENWPERTRDLDGGLEIASYLRAWNAGAVVVVYSASLTVENVVRAMRNGVFDCVDKSRPGSLTELVKRVEAGIEETWVSHEAMGRMLESLSAEFPGQYVAVENGEVVGSDSNIQRLKQQLRSKGQKTIPTIVHVSGRSDAS